MPFLHLVKCTSRTYLVSGECLLFLDDFNQTSFFSTNFSKNYRRIISKKPVPVAERSKARVYGRSLAGIACSNPAGGMDGCPLCVLSGTGLCEGLITRPEESYRLRCTLVCDLGSSRERRLRLVKGCKCRIEEFRKNPFNWKPAVPCGQTDGQTDKQD